MTIAIGRHDVHGLAQVAVPVNPLGASRRAVTAAERALRRLDLYPSWPPRLQQLAAELFEVDTGRVLVTSGSETILRVVMMRAAMERTKIIVPLPSFPGLVHFVQALSASHGAEVAFLPPDEFDIDLQALAHATAQSGNSLVYLTHPNCFSGRALPLQRIRQIADACRNILWLIDEAFIEVSEAETFVGEDIGSVIVVRTMSKAYALASLRIGYGIISGNCGSFLGSFLPKYPISGIADAAACAALSDREHAAGTARRVRELRSDARQRLENLGFVVAAEGACFLIGFPDEGTPVDTLRLALRPINGRVRTYGEWMNDDA